MRRYVLAFSPRAREQLREIYRYVASAASPRTAAAFTDAIVTHCERLRLFPLRGARRDDISPGLRITHYRGRVVIAFDADARAGRVDIVGVFYGGRDYEAALREDPEQPG